jgi:hypothetical protein
VKRRRRAASLTPAAYRSPAMPSKLYDPTKPTVYLDHSTMCDAFRAHLVGGQPGHRAYLPLLSWIERVAQEANLCLSLIHVNELGRWDDQAMGDALAGWWDRLPIVWVHSRMTLEEREGDHWTRVVADVASPGVQPFAPSLMTAFHDIDMKAVGALLASAHPVVSLVETARLIKDRHAEAPIEAATTFREDRAWADSQGWSEEKKHETTEYKVAVALRTCALEADRRLVEGNDVNYLLKTCTGGDVQDRLVDLYQREPKALPIFRLDRKFIEGFIDAAMRKQAGSAKERSALGGSFYDNMHLAGAAHCDVFTCDRVTSEWLGDFRTTIGRRPQLAVGRHPRGVDGFVEELMATWP